MFVKEKLDTKKKKEKKKEKEKRCSSQVILFISLFFIIFQSTLEYILKESYDKKTHVL